MFTTKARQGEAIPQSFNRYAYVLNDPVNFVDPTGLDDDYPFGLGPPPPLPGIIRESVTVVADAGFSWGWGFGGGISRSLPLPDLPSPVEGIGGGESPTPEPPSTDSGAREIETAVEAAMWFMKIGCYPGRSRANNPDIEPHNRQIARISSPERYTSNWRPTVASHGGAGARESSTFRAGTFDWAIKYYPAQGSTPAGIAVTLPSTASGHYVAALEFWTINPSVNVQLARYVLQHIKDCPPGPYSNSP